MTVRELIVALLLDPTIDMEADVFGYDTSTDRSGKVAALVNDVEETNSVFLEFDDTDDLEVEEADVDGTATKH